MATCPKCGKQFPKGEGQTDWFTGKEYCSEDCVEAIKEKNPKLRSFAWKFQMSIFIIFCIIVYFIGKIQGVW